MESTSYPVFIDTNLQTHLVLTISNDDTVLELKIKVMSEHLNCFPGFGKIDVEAIKVERRECYYYLTDSLFAKSAFDGLNGTWHLHVDAVPQVVSREPGSSERLGEASQLKPPAKQQHTKGKKSDDVCKNVTGTPSGEKAEKKKKPSVLEEATSTVMPSEGKDLKRKLTEASLKTRKKKKMEKMRLSPTEISDGENGLSSSGAGKEVSTVDVVPETSKRVEASDADHPSGKSRKLKEKKYCCSILMP
ncbi:hypothetical protein MKW94_017907 [Papaver nudicaule]|uniref:Uncharacterized protein n=1 Tax=Papaver nudicaule TaxID=74823 RepID=A0AA41VVQ0_PAPNU|nr:hypothetical protein [Papaver nudicaule]